MRARVRIEVRARVRVEVRIRAGVTAWDLELCLFIAVCPTVRLESTVASTPAAWLGVGLGLGLGLGLGVGVGVGLE